MRHRKSGSSLNRKSSHRIAMFKNLCKALIDNERIITTVPKAKLLRSYIEPLITLAKKGNEASKRLAVARLVPSKQTEMLVEKLFSDIAVRYKGTEGGYTRIVKMGMRRGDSAPMAVMELTKRNKAIEKNRADKKKKKQEQASEKSKTE